MGFAVVHGVAPAENGVGNDNTVDFVKTGFGTVDALMVIGTIATALNTATNHLMLSVGFGAGPNPFLSWSTSEHGVATSDTSQGAGGQVLWGGGVPGETTINRWAVAEAITDGVRLHFDGTDVTQYRLVVLLFNGMGQVAAGHLTTNATEDATTTVSGLPFRPKLVFFAYTLAGTIDTFGAGCAPCFGVAWDNADSPVQRAICANLPNGAGAATCGGRLTTAHVGGQFAGGGITRSVEYTSTEDDGFVVTSRDGAGGDIMGYLALEMDGWDVWLGTNPTHTNEATDWDVDHSGDTPALDFTPEGMMMMFTPTSGDDVGSATIMASLGIYAFDGDEEMSVCVSDEDASDPMDTQSITSDRLLFVNDDGGTTILDASAPTFQPGGFVFSAANITTANGSARAGALLAFAEQAAPPAGGPHVGSLALMGAGR